MEKSYRKQGVTAKLNMGYREKAIYSWRWPVLAGFLSVATACLVLAAVAIAYQIINASVIFPGVKVAGESVGGMTREEALSALKPLYDQWASRSLLLRMDGIERKVLLSDLGVSFDPAAGVETAYRVGRTGGLIERTSTQLRALVQGYQVESSGIRIDQSKLRTFLAQQAKEIDSSVKDAELVVGDDFSVKISPEMIGRTLDVAGAARAIEKSVSAGADSIELPVLVTLPKRVQKDLEEARATLAKVYSGPVTLQFEGNKWTLTQKEIKDLVTIDYKADVPAPAITIRDEPLKAMVEKIAGGIDQEKVDGRYIWNNGALKPLSAGKDGRKLDRDKALGMLKDAILGEQKVVSLPVEVDKAIGGSIGPAQLGIKERIEYGQTVISGVPEKVYNIKLAASRLNGVVVRPGGTFSFNKELGPTTLKAGFKTGFGITLNNGEMQTVPSVAGGICQVATTLLHAVFWAGYQIEERYPHMYWIASYGQPPKGLTGLDTTVDPPNLDFKFINNTDNYLLIQSNSDNNLLTFELYGTKPSWKVVVEGPIITNVVKADQKEVRQEEPTWEEGRELWVERATDGFDVEIIRKVIQGDDVRTLDLKSRYQPSRNVLMVGTKKPEPTAAPTQTPSATPTSSTPQASPTAVATTTANPGATSVPTAGPSKPVATPTAAGH